MSHPDIDIAMFGVHAHQNLPEAITFFGDSMWTDTFYDLGRHLSCGEADAFVSLLWHLGFEEEAHALAEGHVAYEVKGEDAHYIEGVSNGD